MIRLLGRGRLQLTAAVTVFLVLAGGTGATAYWSGQAQLQTRAGTASMGLAVQSEPAAGPSPLAVQYTAQTRVAAGAVTIRNTGSRDAALELAITAESPTSAQLPAAISVAVAPVTAAADCTSQRVLTAPTRTLSASATSFPLADRLAVGVAPTILCIQTTLLQTAPTSPTVQSLQLAISAKLTYASAATWSTSALVLRVSQSVAAVASAPALRDYARYEIRNDGLCIGRANGNPPAVARFAACDENASQWRFKGVGDGTFRIVAARNVRADRQPDQSWATGQAGSLKLERANLDSREQRWRITAAGTGTYRIESVSTPGQCATIGNGLYNPTDANPRRVVLGTCDATSAAQAFALQVFGTPVAPAQALTCSGSEPWYVQLAFNAPVDYEEEVTYRILLSPADRPSQVTIYTANVWGREARGLGIGASDAELASYIAREGTGNTRVTIEQQIAGSAWTPAATGELRTARVDGSPRIWCGW